MYNLASRETARTGTVTVWRDKVTKFVDSAGRGDIPNLITVNRWLLKKKRQRIIFCWIHLVENIFINEYMTMAPGEYVKVYLFALMYRI